MSENISIQINGVPLIKFQSSERIAKLRKGLIYANTLEYYRKLEERTNDSTVGDRNEAMIHVNKGYFINKETNEKISLDNSLIPTAYSNDYAFCMFGIYPHYEEFKFTEEQKNEIRSFGDTALIITNQSAFIERIRNSADKKGYNTIFNAVNYYDPSIDDANMLLSVFKDLHNVAFWKRNQYAYQQEARFLFTDGDTTLDHIELNIGDISDISEVFTTESMLNGIAQKLK